MKLNEYKKLEEVIKDQDFHKNYKNIDKVIELAKTRMKTLADFKNLVIPNKIELSKEEKNIAEQMFEIF